MRKVILLLLLFSVINSFSQHCHISIDQLFSAIEYDQAAFEAFALEINYTYNSQQKIYLCENKIKLNVLRRIKPSGNIVLSYTFLDLNNYLKIMELLVDGELIEKFYSDDSVGSSYRYNEKRISVETQTLKDGIDAYTVTITKMVK